MEGVVVKDGYAICDVTDEFLSMQPRSGGPFLRMFGTQDADGKIVMSGIYERGTPFKVTWRLTQPDTGKPDASMLLAFKANIDEMNKTGTATTQARAKPSQPSKKNKSKSKTRTTRSAPQGTARKKKSALKCVVREIHSNQIAHIAPGHERGIVKAFPDRFYLSME